MVTPKVIPVGQTAEVVLRGVAGNQTYSVRFYSKVSRAEDGRVNETADATGTLRLRRVFTTAGEYYFEVYQNETAKEPLRTAALFAAKPELYALRPFKGDLHMHTTASDGKDTAEAMATAAKAIGMDFIAITDHDVHPATLPAVAGLVVLPGEESTVREVGGHILALGASAGLGKLRWSATTDTERAALATPRTLAQPLAPAGYAHAVWTMKKIRELGGVALIAHPYWKGSKHKFYPPPAVVTQLLDDELADGLELLGGSPDTEGNRLAIARYGEELRRGRHLAVIGGSDAHAVAELGRYYTLLLAPTLSSASIVEAIRQRRTLACEPRPNGEAAIYGPFDLVEYAYYLHREYFAAPAAARKEFWASC
jgi:hypothetical protein